jgi:hypothetical protein
MRTDCQPDRETDMTKIKAALRKALRTRLNTTTPRQESHFFGAPNRIILLAEDTAAVLITHSDVGLL